MNNVSKKISFGGIAAALCVVLISLCSYIPTGRLAMLFVASELIFVFANFFDIKSAFCVYLAVSVLSVIIGRGGNIAVSAVFLLCLGNYPLFKTVFDKLDIKIRIAIKIIIFAMYFALAWFGTKYILKVSLEYAVALVFIACAIMFFLYDRLLSMVFIYMDRYVQRIIKK